MFLVPKPHQRWRPVIYLSRLNTFLPSRKVQNGNSRVHQGLSDSIDRPIRCLSSHPHPPKLKEGFATGHRCSSSPLFHSAWPLPLRSYNDCKGSEADGPHKLYQYLDDWLIRAQSQKEALVNTQTIVDLTQVWFGLGGTVLKWFASYLSDPMPDHQDRLHTI